MSFAATFASISAPNGTESSVPAGASFHSERRRIGFRSRGPSGPLRGDAVIVAGRCRITAPEELVIRAAEV